MENNLYILILVNVDYLKNVIGLSSYLKKKTQSGALTTLI